MTQPPECQQPTNHRKSAIETTTKLPLVTQPPVASTLSGKSKIFRADDRMETNDSRRESFVEMRKECF